MSDSHLTAGDASSRVEEEPVKAASRFRTALPQVLASTAKNMILLDLGMTVAFPTIVIPALHNTKDPLALNDEQTSWFGSIAYICQPLGSVLSGIVLEHLGRKRSMILVNFPHVIGWFIFYFANSVPMLYVSSVIMGLGVGFMEAPIITYVGEISQPELRGILTSYSGIFVQLGFFLEYLLGTISDWRTAAAISAAVPIATVIAITQVPETPIWLLSRGRMKDAEKALCWLRGWVPPSAVKKEFDELVRYSENMKKLKHTVENGIVPLDATQSKDSAQWSGDEGNACMRKLRDLCRPQTIRPLLLVIMFFFFQHWSGFSAMRPYMVQVFEEFGLPLDAHWTTVVIGLIGIVGNIVCMLGVPWWGKRPISLVSMAVSSMSCIILGGYAFAVISPGEVATAGTRQIASWAPMALFVTLVFMQSIGVLPIPWMILSEVFPFRSRGLASGIAAAASYILAFTASKTFLALKAALHLHGVFWLYGILGFIGFIVIYWTFSETEGRSLEDIEEFYKNGIRGRIPKRAEEEAAMRNSDTLHSAINITTIEKEYANQLRNRSNNSDEDKMINNVLYSNEREGKSYSTSDIAASTETMDTTFTVSTVDLQDPKTSAEDLGKKQFNGTKVLKKKTSTENSTDKTKIGEDKPRETILVEETANGIVSSKEKSMRTNNIDGENVNETLKTEDISNETKTDEDKSNGSALNKEKFIGLEPMEETSCGTKSPEEKSNDKESSEMHLNENKTTENKESDPIKHTSEPRQFDENSVDTRKQSKNNITQNVDVHVDADVEERTEM